MFSLLNSKTSALPSGTPRYAQMSRASCGCALPVKIESSPYKIPPCQGSRDVRPTRTEDTTADRPNSLTGARRCVHDYDNTATRLHGAQVHQRLHPTSVSQPTRASLTTRKPRKEAPLPQMVGAPQRSHVSPCL